MSGRLQHFQNKPVELLQFLSFILTDIIIQFTPKYEIRGVCKIWGGQVQNVRLIRKSSEFYFAVLVGEAFI